MHVFCYFGNYIIEVIIMNEKKRQELKRKLAEVPNPPVPNRARTSMSVKKDKIENNNNAKQRKN